METAAKIDSEISSASPRRLRDLTKAIQDSAGWLKARATNHEKLVLRSLLILSKLLSDSKLQPAVQFLRRAWEKYGNYIRDPQHSDLKQRVDTIMSTKGGRWVLEDFKSGTGRAL